jgi:hypothetical protein
LESGRLEDRVVQDATVRRCIRSRRSHSAGAAAPDLLELCRRNISTIISSNSGPELLTTGFVDGTKSVGVDNAGLVSNFCVDAKSVVRFGRVLRGKRAGLGKKDLVLATTRGCSGGN